MTEAEWQACGDPQALLHVARAVGSERQLRLFACACCRRVWRLLSDRAAREALLVAERFAEGVADGAARSAARKAAQRAAQGRGVVSRPTAPKWERRAASAVYYALDSSAASAAWNAPLLTVEALVWQAGGYEANEALGVQVSETRQQAELLRDIVGNPYRQRPTRFSLNLRGYEETARALATAITGEQSFDQMPILADVLEDAGCADEALCAHLRSSGPHARGCWALDHVLGLE